MNPVDFFLRRIYRGLKNRYEAAQPSRAHRQQRDRASADSDLMPAGEQLVDNARNLENNHDLADGVLNTLCAKIIGTGLTPEPMVKLTNGRPATAFNDQLLDLWRTHARRREVTRKMNAALDQDLSCRTWMRDGEDFTQILAGPVRGLNHRGNVPLSIELLEPDFFPFNYTDPSKNIVQAVEKNGWGEPRAYHKYRVHPGGAARGFQFTSDLRRLSTTFEDLQRIPAQRMLHLAFVKRKHTTRGVTKLHAVMNRFRDVKDYDDSERMAARVAAAFCAILTQNMPPDYEPETGNNRPTLDMEPGAILRGEPGEGLQTIDSKRPNPQLTEFRREQLRSAASSLGTSFSTISRFYDASYSAMRQELVDTEVNYHKLTAWFCDQRETPLWERFVEVVTTQGILRVPRDVDRNTLTRVLFTPPATPWIDPKKEIEADLLAISGGDTGTPLMSWSQVLRKRGMNPQETLEQIVEQRELFEQFNVQPESSDGESDETDTSQGESTAA